MHTYICFAINAVFIKERVFCRGVLGVVSEKVFAVYEQSVYKFGVDLIRKVFSAVCKAGKKFHLRVACIMLLQLKHKQYFFK